jgi:hypothetical protein
MNEHVRPSQSASAASTSHEQQDPQIDGEENHDDGFQPQHSLLVHLGVKDAV